MFFPLHLFQRSVFRYLYSSFEFGNICLYIHISKVKGFFLLSCCITFLFKTTKVNKWTYICKSFVFVVSCSVAAGIHPQPCSHTRKHTLHTQKGRKRNTPAWSSALCIKQKPLPAGIALPSFSSERTAVSLHHPKPPSKKVRGGGGGGWGEWADGWRTCLQVLCLWPAAATTMTIIMMMMTKMMTQRNAVLQSIWPPIYH